MTDLSKLTSLLIDESQKLEPCQVEVCCDDSENTKIIFENSDFSVASQSRTSVFGLRAIVDQRLGFVTTNSLSESALRDKVREVQQVARLSPKSPHHQIAEKTQTQGVFELADAMLVGVQPKELMQWLQLLVDEARKDVRVTLDRAELELSTSVRIIHNSNGIFQKVKQTTCNWFVMGMAKNDNEVTSFDYEGDSTSNFNQVAPLIEKTAREFRESVVGSLGARSAKSYKGPILLHPAAVSSLLASVVSFNVNGRAQQDGMSKWADKLGQKIASPLFGISENPQDTSRPGDWSPFDREGVPTQNRPIVEKGILKFTAHNCFSSHRGQTKPTGNAIGSSRWVPEIGLHNLTMDAGKSSLNELNEALNTGLMLKRFSGNSDPVSGQFSGVAKNSWWVEKGKRAWPLKEIMVSGNMFDLLEKIQLVGKDTFRQMGSFDSPFVLVDDVSVTSGG